MAFPSLIKHNHTFLIILHYCTVIMHKLCQNVNFSSRNDNNHWREAANFQASKCKRSCKWADWRNARLDFFFFASNCGAEINWIFIVNQAVEKWSPRFDTNWSVKVGISRMQKLCRKPYLERWRWKLAEVVLRFVFFILRVQVHNLFFVFRRSHFLLIKEVLPHNKGICDSKFDWTICWKKKNLKALKIGFTIPVRVSFSTEKEEFRFYCLKPVPFTWFNKNKLIVQR